MKKHVLSDAAWDLCRAQLGVCILLPSWTHVHQLPGSEMTSVSPTCIPSLPSPTQKINFSIKTFNDPHFRIIP